MSEYSNKLEQSNKKEGESEAWLSVYVIALWQNAGGLSHRSCI